MTIFREPMLFWEPMLLFPLLALLIPVGILIGQHWQRGPLVSLSAGAALGVVIYLALTWSSFTVDYYPVYPYSTVETLMLVAGLLVVGAILLLGALALAFTDALRERRRVWAIVQCALVYVSFVGMLGFMLEPVRFCGELPSGTYCSPPDVGRFALFAALSLAGPIATLAYALLAQGRAAAMPASEQPEGLTI
ncbi:MAG TPA: hypothetical protein VIG77_04230 [Ktedonobacterales bacterium]|jgi:hypothetical protein